MELKFDTNNSKGYEVEALRDSAVYTKELEDQIPSLYYLVAWKGYHEEENT